jgi:hypothetical protein
VPYTHLELHVGAKHRFVAVYRLNAEHQSWCKEMPVLGDALRRHTRSVSGTEYDEQREGRRITAGLQQRPGHPRKRLTDG